MLAVIVNYWVDRIPVLQTWMLERDMAESEMMAVNCQWDDGITVRIAT